MIRALIIDDEAPARGDLRAMLAAHPEVAVVGEAATVKTARALFAKTECELVFLDIALVGGSGFDLVPAVRPGTRIIFVTAHNEHALRAFEVNALDYLLKPVKAERLTAALARMAQPSPPTDAPAGLALRADDIVQLLAAGHARFAPVADICVIEAQENYTLVHLADHTSILVRRTLTSWEEILPPALFMRVHRSAVVNLARITAYRRDAARALTLQVQPVNEPVAVGRQFWPELKARLPGAAAAAGEE